MAKYSAALSLLPLFIIFSTIANLEAGGSFSTKLSPSSLGLEKEKLTHLHFYFHDIVSGNNVTAVRVAQANVTATSPTFFGATAVIDDALTETPELNSTIIGRAQGMYALTSQSEATLVMVMNLAFLQGKYNGSTVAVLGRNRVFSAVREMPIVGGSGVFRFARGYALARTHQFDLNTGNTCVEYDLYVLHY